MGMKISRQHSETEITEIVGKRCSSILAVGGSIANSIIIFYVSFADVWLRIFLDAGVLFVETCDEPDREDDLDEGSDYIDIAKVYGLSDAEVDKASMKGGVFKLGFKCGTLLLFEQQGDETELRVIK
jgi:hypothetical protein